MGALDDANTFLSFLIEHRELFQGSRQSFPPLQAEIHCCKCGGRRRVDLRVLYAPPMPDEFVFVLLALMGLIVILKRW
jgi:hypothetical protein